MLEILTYDFFQKALIAGLLVSCISGSLWTLVVLRREPNITHAISNFIFLWIVVSLFFSQDYYIFGVAFALIWVIALLFLEKSSHISRESSKEVLSQIWLASGIFLIGILWNVQLDIFNFLFGNILFTSSWDIAALVIMLLVWSIWALLFHKRIIRITLSPDIAKSQWIRVDLYEFGYLLYLSLFIAFSIKMFWVMLLWAFLVLPANIWKKLSSSLKGVFLIATIISIISVIIGLFLSYFFDTSAWATVVVVLWVLFLLSHFKKPI